MKKLPLEGVRVLDVTRIIYGPWAATLLALLGAEVIHVEMPKSGDTLIRLVSPGGVFPRNLSPGMMCCNANKYFVAIDMRREEGRELIRKLAARCDVLMENFKPGTFDRWGIGYRQLSEINPRLIYVSMQGFGNWGELWERPSYDAYAQGITGLAEITGFEEAIPVKSQAWIGDFLSGTIAAFTTLAALYWRNKSGKGQFIDMSQAEVLMRAMDWTWLYISLTGENRKRYGNRDPAVVVSCIARAKDGFVAIAAVRDDEYLALCKAIGREDLEKFVNYEKRVENFEEIYNAIEDWAKNKSVEEILRKAEESGFAASRVMNSKNIYESEHYRRRNAVQIFFDPIYEELCYPFALHFSNADLKVLWSMRPVGFDNEHVFRRILGLSEEELRLLYEKEVIGKWDERIPTTAPPEGKEDKAFY